jgi:hypothetical protein
VRNLVALLALIVHIRKDDPWLGETKPRHSVETAQKKKSRNNRRNLIIALLMSSTDGFPREKPLRKDEINVTRERLGGDQLLSGKDQLGGALFDFDPERHKPPSPPFLVGQNSRRTEDQKTFVKTSNDRNLFDETKPERWVRLVQLGQVFWRGPSRGRGGVQEAVFFFVCSAKKDKAN